MQGLNQHQVLFASEVFALFAVWFSFVSWVTSLAAGWRSLARKYRTDREFPEHRRRMQRAAMRSGVRINNVLTIGSDVEGIYVGLTIPIMLGYPRLFIPWTDILVEEPRRWMFYRTQRLVVGRERIGFRIREPLAQFLLEPRGGNAATAPGMIGSSF